MRYVGPMGEGQDLGSKPEFGLVAGEQGVEQESDDRVDEGEGHGGGGWQWVPGCLSRARDPGQRSGGPWMASAPDWARVTAHPPAPTTFPRWPPRSPGGGGHVAVLG